MVEVDSVVELVSAVVVGSLGIPYNIILLYKREVRNVGSSSDRLGSVRANGVKENIKGQYVGGNFYFESVFEIIVYDIPVLGCALSRLVERLGSLSG